MSNDSKEKRRPRTLVHALMEECEAIRQRRLVTVPNERTKSVLHTRAFLELLAAGCLRDYEHEDLKMYVEGLLQHYPNTSDMHLVAMALPTAWGPRWVRPEVMLNESGSEAHQSGRGQSFQ